MMARSAVHLDVVACRFESIDLVDDDESEGLTPTPFDSNEVLRSIKHGSLLAVLEHRRDGESVFSRGNVERKSIAIHLRQARACIGEPQPLARGHLAVIRATIVIHSDVNLAASDFRVYGYLPPLFREEAVAQCVLDQRLQQEARYERSLRVFARLDDELRASSEADVLDGHVGGQGIQLLTEGHFLAV